MSATQPAWLRSLASCPSTNAWALERLPELPAGTCVWTERQQAGRGQRGRRWLSPPGVLTASFVIDLAPAPINAQLALVAGLAVAHCCEERCPGRRVQLKWPNDCWHADRKLAGILCEGSQIAGRHRTIVGIGLNLDPDWRALDLDPEDLPEGGVPATSLAALGATELEPLPLLQDLRQRLLEGAALLETGRWDDLHAQLQSRDALAGRTVALQVGERRHVGQAMGIDADGALLLAQAGGIQAYASGSATPLPTAATTTVSPAGPGKDQA